MNKAKISAYALALYCIATITGCKIPEIAGKKTAIHLPSSYNNEQSERTSVRLPQYLFKDMYLNALIDSAVVNNQELNILLNEIIQASNEVRIKKGAYLPSASTYINTDVTKVGRYTNIGAMEANTEILPGKKMPEPLSNMSFGVKAGWEVDIWKKLRNAKLAALKRYAATVEGKNFFVTNLVAEIAHSYFELLALDRQLAIVNQNIDIQSNALRIVKLQKEAAKVTELAVKKFEAEVAKTKSMQYDITQRITETENRINYLIGRYPQKIPRDKTIFDTLPDADILSEGIPSELLTNRSDIKAAEHQLSASKLDVKVAKAQFYPSLGISASIGYNAFNPRYITNPESLIYAIGGDLAAPIINRNAIKAEYVNANARQIQAAYNYERTILNAYIEVSNQLNKAKNLKLAYEFKSEQVQALKRSISISNDLFQSARADYMEILMTQRDALDATFELIDTRKEQLTTIIELYRSLGGGWGN